MRRALKFLALVVLILLFVALIIAAFLIYWEAETSTYQAHRLARLAGELNWEVKSGPSDDPHFPQSGPYDVRLGYSRLPEMLHNLVIHGFQVQAQARASARMKELVAHGLFVPYHEKTQAGLEIAAGGGRPLYRAIFPGRVYKNFEAVPSLVADSLLFIENRELLDPIHSKKNLSLIHI